MMLGNLVVHFHLFEVARNFFTGMNDFEDVSLKYVK